MANNEELILNVETTNPYVIGAVAKVEQLPNGALITIVDKNGTTTATVLNGVDGTGIASATLNEDYTLTLLFTDGTSTTTESIRGATGESGVYCGETEPTNPDVNVWVDTTGDPYPMEEEIAESVDDWITAHPEYVTTVQDGAITVPKFAAGVVDATLTQSGHPADAKATGDAFTSDRSRLTSVESAASSLDARVTNLATLTDGSTTGDAELMDARTVGSTTYTSLHQAIDTEFTNVKSNLTNVANRMNHIVALVSTTPTYNMLDNKVISADGTVVSTTGTSFKVTDYIPVEAGNVVTFKYSRARWNNKNWAFYDTDKNVVSVYPKFASGITVEMNGVLVVPNRAKYFVVGYDVSNTQPLPDVRVVTKYAESINNVAESAAYQYTDAQLTEESITATNSSSKVIGTDCFILDISSADYKVSQASVSYGDVITIRNCSARYTSKMYAFYDVADSPIYSVSRVDDNAHDFKAIEVPFGAVKIAVSGYGTYATLSKVTKIATASSAWSGKKWACMGDSLTDADNARATKRYFDYIEDATGITVVNLGKSGTGYKKEHNSNLPFYQRVDTIPLDSDVITIFGSGNDCNQTLGDVTDTGTTTVCGCINNTIDGIRARIVGANIGIITPTPWEPYPPSTVGNKMDLYSEALVEICKRKGVPCLDLYHCSNMLPWEQSFREAFYTHDDGGGTHPDENGHKFFAPHIKAFLETLLM